MTQGRRVVWIAVGVIVLVTLVSGPLVPWIGFTEERPAPDFGNGAATITDVETPDSAVIEPMQFGGEKSTLAMQPSSVQVQAVTGSPFISYKVRIPAMNTTRIQLYQLSPADTGQTVQLRYEEATIQAPPNDVEELDGEVVIILRNRTSEQELASTNITITVNH